MGTPGPGRGDGLCPGVTSRKAAGPTSTPGGCVTRPPEPAGSVSRSHELNRWVTSAPAPNCCGPAHTHCHRRYADGHGRGVPVADGPACGRGGRVGGVPQTARHRRRRGAGPGPCGTRTPALGAGDRSVQTRLWRRPTGLRGAGPAAQPPRSGALRLRRPRPGAPRRPPHPPGRRRPGNEQPAHRVRPAPGAAAHRASGPGVRTGADEHPGATPGPGRSALAGGARLCGRARAARGRTGPPAPGGGAAAPATGRRGTGRAQPPAGPECADRCRPVRRRRVQGVPRARTYRTSGTSTPSTSKGSSAPSGRKPERS